MKHVALIMAHENLKQISKLMRLILSGGWEIIAHIDKVMPNQMYQALRDTFNKDPVIFLDRQRVPWGSYASIEVELRLLHEAVLQKADYLHLLSGSDLPIKTFSQIDNFFMKHSGKEFIEVITDWGNRREIRERISLYHPLQYVIGRNKNLLYQLQRGSNFLQRTLHVDRLNRNSVHYVYGGMNWFSITHEFASYVLRKKDWIRKTFCNSLCGDELFLQTLLGGV